MGKETQREKYRQRWLCVCLKPGIFKSVKLCVSCVCDVSVKIKFLVFVFIELNLRIIVVVDLKLQKVK